MRRVPFHDGVLAQCEQVGRGVPEVAAQWGGCVSCSHRTDYRKQFLFVLCTQWTEFRFHFSYAEYAVAFQFE